MWPVAVLGLFHVGSAWFARRYHLSSRQHWHVLHILVNVLIAATTAYALLRPAVTDCAPSARPSTFPITLAVWTHVWHCVFFHPTWADWQHHLVFVPTLGVPGLWWDWGSCGDAQLFYVCGLPGACIYAMSVAKACGWTRVARVAPALTYAINLFVRMPGILWAQHRLWSSWTAGVPEAPTWAVMVQVVLGATNAVYYTFDAAARVRG